MDTPEAPPRSALAWAATSPPTFKAGPRGPPGHSAPLGREPARLSTVMGGQDHGSQSLTACCPTGLCAPARALAPRASLREGHTPTGAWPEESEHKTRFAASSRNSDRLPFAMFQKGSRDSTLGPRMRPVGRGHQPQRPTHNTPAQHTYLLSQPLGTICHGSTAEGKLTDANAGKIA